MQILAVWLDDTGSHGINYIDHLMHVTPAGNSTVQPAFNSTLG